MAYDRTNPGTKLENLINPEVLAEFISYKLEAAIKFAPLCGVNRDLEGRPGSILTLPRYTYIGDADIVPEGEDVLFGNLGKETAKVTVQKAGRGVKITDEAILNAYGNPADEIAKQLLMAIANKVDNDCVAQFRNASEKMTVSVNEFNKDAVIDMIAKFGEDMDEDMVLVINAQHLAALRKEDDFMHVMNGQTIISGEIGQIFGARVVVSNKVQPNEAFLVKQGAVKILLKRDVMVEADRDIINKTNIFVVDEHYAVYLEDDSKLVKATIA